ncbi:MAG: leucine-rich repeat domain-containing protein [Oscillospiraceae bacterium]|nr:leucine-rich repeat domain-containing protein [Oscillospiraceae bacterium]
MYKVDDNIFRNCSALTEIKLPSSLVEIGEYVFADTGLTSVSIPKPMRNLGEHMFDNCTALVSVTLAPKQSKMNSTVPPSLI